MRLLLYTTAPEILDGPETRPGWHAGFTSEGVPVRSVEIGLAAGVAQVRRYLETGGSVWTPCEWTRAVANGIAYSEESATDRAKAAEL